MMPTMIPAPATVPSIEYVPSHPRIAFTRQGTGDTVIFLHGIGGGRINWRGQLAYFSSSFQAVAWDARGYGASEDYEGPCRFEDFSDDLAGLLKHLEVPSAHFVGLSMGGRILMDFADRYPAHVKSLVIAASFPSFGKTLTQAQQEDFMRQRRAPLEAGISLVEMASSLVDGLLGPNATPAIRNEALQSLTSLRKDSYLKVLEATLTFDRTDALKRSQVPTLLLFGENDTLVKPEAGLAVKALMPHARMAVIGGVGHLLNLEAPAEFNRLVEEFIQSQRA